MLDYSLWGENPGRECNKQLLFGRLYMHQYKMVLVGWRGYPLNFGHKKYTQFTTKLASKFTFYREERFICMLMRCQSADCLFLQILFLFPALSRETWLLGIEVLSGLHAVHIGKRSISGSRVPFIIFFSSLKQEFDSSLSFGKRISGHIKALKKPFSWSCDFYRSLKKEMLFYYEVKHVGYSSTWQINTLTCDWVTSNDCRTIPFNYKSSASNQLKEMHKEKPQHAVNKK